MHYYTMTQGPAGRPGFVPSCFVCPQRMTVLTVHLPPLLPTAHCNVFHTCTPLTSFYCPNCVTPRSFHPSPPPQMRLNKSCQDLLGPERWIASWAPCCANAGFASHTCTACVTIAAPLYPNQLLHSSTTPLGLGQHSFHNSLPPPAHPPPLPTHPPTPLRCV